MILYFTKRVEIFNSQCYNKKECHAIRGKAMIKTKQDLKRYLTQDAKALKVIGKKRPSLVGDEVWKYQILLRKREYYANMKKSKRLLRLPYFILLRYRFRKASIKLGFTIPLNVFGEGFSIAHYGTIVVNGSAKVGINCRIQEGVNIGATNGTSNAPVIGNNVFIGTGAKIIGGVKIADDVCIGANAVVVKSIDEPGTTWGGVPARKISNNSSRSNLSPYLFE